MRSHNTCCALVIQLLCSKICSEGILSVSALGELVFGAKTVEEISKEEGVSMSGRMASELEKIIPLSRIYLNEAV